MSLRNIVTPPDPVLRARAKKIRTITSEIERLIEDMIETMRNAPGVGLAAPQVGISQQLFVAEYAEPNEDPEAPPKPAKLYVFINPEIVRRSKATNLGNEGCLSIPGYLGEVERNDTVTVKGLDRHGNPVRVKAKDWLARIFQHEIDHLEGVLYIDKATKVWKIEEEEQPTKIPVG